MNKICVILGAGASHDVYNGSSPIINPAFKPPLARDLFNIENNKEYWQILQYYPGAQVITDLLAPLTAKDEFSVEQELRRYSNHTDVRLQENFKFVPPYLRDLIYRASNEYTSSQGCYTQLVSELLSENPHEALFLVLNYDNLLEKAITRYDRSLTFQPISDYVKEGRQAKVVKLHGSINWFTTFSTHRSNGWEDLVRELDTTRKRDEGDIHVLEGIPTVKDSGIDSQWLYPLITAPLAGKGLTDAVCPESHLDAARDFLKDCKKFLIIGTSGLDEDLMTFLESSIAPNVDFNPAIQVVDADPTLAENTLRRFEIGVRAFNMVIHSRESRIGGGFRSYLSSDEFHSFAQLDPSSRP